MYSARQHVRDSSLLIDGTQYPQETGKTNE